MVAPYSGAMLLRVARSASVSEATPGPKYSTNLPTTPLFLSMFTHFNTRSVAVASYGSLFTRRKPTTYGRTIDIVCPSMTAYASIPPTPHPRTPRPLIIVV